MKTDRAALLLSLLLIVGARGATTPPSLDLPRCFALALEHNPELRTASTQFLAAEGQAIKLHAILYPSIQAQALSTPLVLYVQIQQTFYSAATLPRLRLSRLTRDEAFLNYRQALVDVFFQVRQAFTAALGAGEQERAAHELVESRQAAVKTGDELFHAGHLQRSDVLPLEVLANLAHEKEALLRLDRQQAVLALAQVLGVDLPADEPLTGTLEDNGPARLDLAALDAQALQDRLDLQLLENARLSAAQQIRIDLKNTLPARSDSSPTRPSSRPPFFPVGAGSPLILERNYSGTRDCSARSGNTQLAGSPFISTGSSSTAASLPASGRPTNRATRHPAGGGRRATALHSRARLPPPLSIIQAERETLAPARRTKPRSASVERDATVDYQAGRVRLLDKVNLETDIVDPASASARQPDSSESGFGRSGPCAWGADSRCPEVLSL